MVMDFKVGTEVQQYVWGGAIPLQIHLHDSEVATLPPPPPALVKPFFSSSLPPGVDTVWFEYKGLPLKWLQFLSFVLSPFSIMRTVENGNQSELIC